MVPRDCRQAANRADSVTANMSLVILASNAAGDGTGGDMIGRGLIAGVLLSVFATLIGILLVCCLCSLKRARLHRSLRNRRPSAVLSSVAGTGNGLLHGGSSKTGQLEQLAPLFQRNETSGGGHTTGNGMTNLQVAGQSADKSSKTDSRMVSAKGRTKVGKSMTGILLDAPQEKQWLVMGSSAEAKPAQQSSRTPPSEVDGHRQIAMYSASSNAVPAAASVAAPAVEEDRVVDVEDATPSGSYSSDSRETALHRRQSVVAAGQYPDVVEASGAADYAASQLLLQPAETPEELSLTPSVRFHRRELPSVSSYRSRRSFSYNGGGGDERRRLSDWELNESSLSVDPDELWPGDSSPYGTAAFNDDDFELDETGPPQMFSGRRRRRCSEDESLRCYSLAAADEDDVAFRRRYAYHTNQLNRFLEEYRALQSRLSSMQVRSSLPERITPSPC